MLVVDEVKVSFLKLEKFEFNSGGTSQVKNLVEVKESSECELFLLKERKECDDRGQTEGCSWMGEKRKLLC